MTELTEDTEGDALDRIRAHIQKALEMLDEHGEASRSGAYLAMALDALPASGVGTEEVNETVTD